MKRWLGTVIWSVALLGASLAIAGCDWANVGGPW
jgi:hypothetical protein